VSDIDYRVDPSKLTFRKPYTDPVPPGFYRPEPQMCPPIQCLARYAAPKHFGLKWWEIILHFILNGPMRGDELRSYVYAERCNQFLGHWEYEGQREHINGFGQHWPVTAVDTKPYNPSET
jgi:hypothetical protein